MNTKNADKPTEETKNRKVRGGSLAEDRVRVALQVPKADMERIRAATQIEINSAAVLAAARKGTEFIERTENILMAMAGK